MIAVEIPRTDQLMNKRGIPRIKIAEMFLARCNFPYVPYEGADHGIMHLLFPGGFRLIKQNKAGEIDGVLHGKTQCGAKFLRHCRRQVAPADHNILEKRRGIDTCLFREIAVGKSGGGLFLFFVIVREKSPIIGEFEDAFHLRKYTVNPIPAPWNKIAVIDKRVRDVL